jgi:hypothetical protein
MKCNSLPFPQLICYIAGRKCCYITVKSATAASQNGFALHKLLFRNETNIIQEMTKNIGILILLS